MHNAFRNTGWTCKLFVGDHIGRSQVRCLLAMLASRSQRAAARGAAASEQEELRQFLQPLDLSRLQSSRMPAKTMSDEYCWFVVTMDGP